VLVGVGVRGFGNQTQWCCTLGGMMHYWAIGQRVFVGKCGVVGVVLE